MTTWILIGSTVLVGICGLIAYILVKIKIKKMKNEYIDELDRAENAANNIKNKDLDLSSLNKNDVKLKTGKEKVLARTDLGELFWDFDADLINKKINHLAFIDMEFLINTIFRNDYKSFLQWNTNCGYEIITLASKKPIDLYYKNIENNELWDSYIKQYGVNVQNIREYKEGILYDSILISTINKNIIEKVVESYKILSKNGMIFIIGLQNRKNKRIINDLKKYLKLVDYRFEENKTCKNIMLIAK